MGAFAAGIELGDFKVSFNKNHLQNMQVFLDSII